MPHQLDFKVHVKRLQFLDGWLTEHIGYRYTSWNYDLIKVYQGIHYPTFAELRIVFNRVDDLVQFKLSWDFNEDDDAD